MPDFPIVDTHVHLWDPHRFRMPWLSGLDGIDRPFGTSEYADQTAQVHVEAYIAVEAGVEPGDSPSEARWLNSLAKNEPRIVGIVAAAPLEMGERAGIHLESLVALGPQIKGVRRIIQGHADPDLCIRTDFLTAVRMLPRFGWTFDICIVHSQLPQVIEMVSACPETEFILDHIAKPAIKEKVVDPWRDNLSRLAALPNVACKISGAVTEADMARWTVAELEPYISHVLGTFGEDRVMFGSDWPVVLMASSYARWIETLDILTRHLSPAAQQKFWRDNARRIYRLS